MELNEIKAKVFCHSDYDFLNTNPYLKNSTILIGLGGSHAYGTNTENSDLDIRGIAVNKPDFILTGRDFEQVVNTATDTTIYSFDKMLKLLCECNPNTIELLGLKPEHYIKVTPLGQMLLDKKSMFLSKRAIYSFGGYANDQLRRLENKSVRDKSPAMIEHQILKSIENALHDIKRRHATFGESGLNLYLDTVDNHTEIYMDVNLQHYPLRDYTGMHSELMAIVKEYGKNSVRNEKAIAHGKLAKHMMHLIRLYLMGIDILENEQIVTYREKDLPLLMDIRNGKFLTEDNLPTKDFWELLNEYTKRFEYAKENTSLPNSVDMEKVRDFQYYVNSYVINNRIY